MFRTLTIGASALSILAMPVAAGAQSYDRDRVSREEFEDSRDRVREERRELRDAQRYGDRDDVREERREFCQAQGEFRRDRQDWRSYRNYDYNRPARGQNAYYADQYYRDGRYYQARTLGPNDRVYRGRDNRYYCRRDDGTTGLIIGGLSGGVLGNVIAPGGSKTLGTVLGGGLGAILGRSIDRNEDRGRRGNVTCR